MHHLNKAFHHLRSSLPLNFADQFSSAITDDDVSNRQNTLNVETTISSFLSRPAIVFYEELHFSVISGEYVEDLTSARQILDQIEGYLMSLAASIDFSGFPNMTNASQLIFTDAFLLPIRDSLNNYKILIDFVNRHLNYQPGTSMIFSVMTNEETGRNSIDTSARSESELFQMNLEVALIDHFLSFQKRTFRKLLMLQHRISKVPTPTEVSDIVSKKCNFLIYKLSFRLQQTKKKYEYAINLNYSSVNLIAVTEFDTLNDLIKGHYDEGINPSIYNLRREQALAEFEKPTNSLKLDQYHALIKYFKDDVKSITKLQRLENCYEVFYNAKVNGPISNFDRKAYDIAFCYLENNLLSLELERKKITLNNWESKFKKYTERAEQFKSSNFFPYFKIIKEFLSPEIVAQFNKQDGYDFALISSLIEKYEINLKKLIENTGICEEMGYLPFQADFEAANVEIKTINGSFQKCFLCSSFVLPLDYLNFKDSLEAYKAELTKFKAMLDNQRLMLKDRKNIQSMKADIERTDKRHIEILSIFAAIVMFVSNEIQIFTKITNMADAVAYTLFFAYGLGVFVLLIWFITRPEGVSWKSFSLVHYLIFIFFSGGLIYGVTYIKKHEHVKTSDERKIEHLNFQIEALKKQIAIDSLKTRILNSSTATIPSNPSLHGTK